MSRRRYETRRRPAPRRRTTRRRSGGRPSLFYGRTLMTVGVLFCIWAWAKGQPT